MLIYHYQHIHIVKMINSTTHLRVFLQDARCLTSAAALTFRHCSTYCFHAAMLLWHAFARKWRSARASSRCFLLHSTTNCTKKEKPNNRILVTIYRNIFIIQVCALLALCYVWYVWCYVNDATVPHKHQMHLLLHTPPVTACVLQASASGATGISINDNA